jgi:hypothetical protein
VVAEVTSTTFFHVAEAEVKLHHILFMVAADWFSLQEAVRSPFSDPRHGLQQLQLLGGAQQESI